jgi:cytochrome b involved in lipid metabolism
MLKKKKIMYDFLMSIIMKKLVFIITIIVISSCANTRNTYEIYDISKTYEKFELLPYGISVNEGKEILKINNITIIDEETRKYNNGNDLCILTIKGAFIDKDCYIEYHFMGDSLIQGFYKFNALGYEYDYTENEIEELLQFYVNNFAEQFNTNTNIYDYGNLYLWKLDNKIQIVITRISDNSFIIESIGIENLINYGK